MHTARGEEALLFKLDSILLVRDLVGSVFGWGKSKITRGGSYEVFSCYACSFLDQEFSVQVLHSALAVSVIVSWSRQPASQERIRAAPWKVKRNTM